jgi:nicotinate-nucleotide adenylyltransferase
MMAFHRLGVLGGSFDPLHIGHLLIAQEALSVLGLDHVLFVPAGDPPHKASATLTAAHHRYAMLEEALYPYPRFVAARFDLDRPGPHYTVDTLAEVSRAYPGASLHFLMGADQLRDFASWRRPADIIAQARLAVANRPGTDLHVEEVARADGDIEFAIDAIHPPPVWVSGTEIRARVAEGRPISFQVLPAVEAYIYRHRLYQEAAEAVA